VNGDLGVGGVVRVMLLLVSQLDGLHPVVAVRAAEGRLLSACPPHVPLYRLAGGTAVTDVERVRPPSPPTSPPRGLTLRSLLDLWRECLGLRRIVRLTGARTVSTFLMRGHIVAFVTRALFVPRLRLMVNVHEHVSERAGIDYPKRLERALHTFLVRFLFRRADAVVVPTRAVGDDLVASYRIPPANIVACRNPVDLDAVRARATDDVEAWADRRIDRRLVVGVGRLVESKGYHVLVEAMARLSSSPAVHAVIVGDGPERAALESLAHRLGIADRVRLIGWHANPWKYIARADVFVQPSRSEAQGLVFVEAMALGVPVIGTSGSAGVRESLGNGRHGLLVPSDDAGALADAIADLIGDPARRHELVTGGLAAAAAHALPVTIKAYQSVLSGAGRAARPA
jgi:glycosyltransferase involved in cell wall biosynthesis